MEALTRLVTESLARHGLDRPMDPRRLQWSRWFPCDSPHSLLVVPSKPGIFALAEEISTFGAGTAHVGADALVRPTPAGENHSVADKILAGAALPRCDPSPPERQALAAAGIADGSSSAENVRRMLPVLQFTEDDDMAFTLDRMFTRPNPMRDRLAKGRCFLRFVVVQDQAQRRSICSALNQWMVSSEKASGIGADFASSLELTDRVGQALSAFAGSTASPAQAILPELKQKPACSAAPHLDSGAATNIHCPQPLPSGF
jgi:hypothetical protein